MDAISFDNFLFRAISSARNGEREKEICDQNRVINGNGPH